jgi:hypothetical protein
VSVTSADEPAGDNCAHGGSKFTAANGVTYACNGFPGTGGSGWSLGGNAGTNPVTHYLGTSDNKPLELRVNGARALRLEPQVSGVGAPNVIGGHSANHAEPGTTSATISGGGQIGTGANTVSDGGTVGGGVGNTAGPLATVVGGSHNTASGVSSVVLGGDQNTAAGGRSLAAGSHADASHYGSFVWSDGSPLLIPFTSTADNEFSVRATGGVRFVSGVSFEGGSFGSATAGVSLAPGSGSWSSLSDRALKRNFATVESSWVLERLAGLPISTWSYRAQEPSIRHLGPTAQDFRRAFGLGVDSRHIDSIDSEGVSLAGVKALYELVQAQQREIAVLKRRVARLERTNEREAQR